MRQAGLFWWGVIAGLGALDLWCHRNETVGDTLSEVTRATFHTHHPAGRAAFAVAWGVLSWWLIPHINRKVEGSLS